MPTIYAEIDINAPQSVVWEALIRKDQWRFWNTFFYDCDPGLTITRGNEIFLAMQRLEGDEETELQPVITMLRAPYVMKWVSTIPGLRSEHVFELRETMPGRTHYIHRETFSGILSKVFLPFIRQDERQGLRRMAQQLKMHVENTILGTMPPSQRRNPRDFYPQQGYPQQGYPQSGNRPYSERPYSRQPYNNQAYGDRPDVNRPYDSRQPQPNRPYDDRYPPSQPAPQRPPYPPQTPQNGKQQGQYSRGPYNGGQNNGDHQHSSGQYSSGQYSPENKPDAGRQNDYPTYNGYNQNDTTQYGDRNDSNRPF